MIDHRLALTAAEFAARDPARVGRAASATWVATNTAASTTPTTSRLRNPITPRVRTPVTAMLSRGLSRVLARLSGHA